MVQTPQQRRANAKFAKAEEEKRGKPVSKKLKTEVKKSPISWGWMAVLATIIIGGIFVELVRTFFY